MPARWVPARYGRTAGPSPSGSWSSRSTFHPPAAGAPQGLDDGLCLILGHPALSGQLGHRALHDPATAGLIKADDPGSHCSMSRPVSRKPASSSIRLCLSSTMVKSAAPRMPVEPLMLSKLSSGFLLLRVWCTSSTQMPRLSAKAFSLPCSRSRHRRHFQRALPWA